MLRPRRLIMLLRVLNRFISYVIKVFSSLHQTIHPNRRAAKKRRSEQSAHRHETIEPLGGVCFFLYLVTKTMCVLCVLCIIIIIVRMTIDCAPHVYYRIRGKRKARGWRETIGSMRVQYTHSESWTEIISVVSIRKSSGSRFMNRNRPTNSLFHMQAYWIITVSFPIKVDWAKHGRRKLDYYHHERYTRIL